MRTRDELHVEARQAQARLAELHAKTVRTQEEMAEGFRLIGYTQALSFMMGDESKVAPALKVAV